MTVDVLRKETESIIFQGNYYKISVASNTLQNYYLKIRDNTPELVKYNIINWVKDNMKIIKTNVDGITKKEDLQNIFISSIEELSYAVEKFFDLELCNWDIIVVDDQVKVINTFTKKEDENLLD